MLAELKKISYGFEDVPVLEEIEALKEEGKIFLIRPSEPLSISRTSKDPVEIEAVYQIGMEDGKRQLPALFEWLRG